jgi:hypothetical protein
MNKYEKIDLFLIIYFILELLVIWFVSPWLGFIMIELELLVAILLFDKIFLGGDKEK